MSNVKRCPRPPHERSSSNGKLMDWPPGRLVLCADKIWRQWNAGIFICSSNAPRAARASGVAGGARGGAALMPAPPCGGGGGGGGGGCCPCWGGAAGCWGGAAGMPAPPWCCWPGRIGQQLPWCQLGWSPQNLQSGNGGPGRWQKVHKLCTRGIVARVGRSGRVSGPRALSLSLSLSPCCRCCYRRRCYCCTEARSSPAALMPAGYNEDGLLH